jgi:hypothetical protein
MVVALVFSVAGSLIADAILVKLGTSLFPSTKHYSHFQFWDYGGLTTIGVACACGAWPIVTRITSDSRQFFFRLSVAVTLILWIPDVWLLTRHQPFKAVAVLMAMHLAIALITYNILVHAAQPEGVSATALTEPAIEKSIWSATTEVDRAEASQTTRPVLTMRRSFWAIMLIGVSAEFGAGILALFLVPIRRTGVWLPTKGQVFYLVHASLGGALGFGALAVLLSASRGTRLERLAALTGLAGIALGGFGGLLTVSHPWRIPGMGLMFLGSALAFFSYLTPLVEEGEGTDQSLGTLTRSDGS